MKKIVIFDTSVGSLNLGDEIILDSVKKELNNIFKHNTMFINLPTHERISRYSHKIIKESCYSFVAGTNLLSSRHYIIRENQWNINLMDSIKFSNVILMGVGWSDYQQNPNYLTKLIYRNALSKRYFHSVRDNYTKNKLESIGIKNVYNTGCPTIWGLTSDHCKEIPSEKADNVVFTLTDYRKDPKNDKEMIDILKKNYDKLFFWIQGSNDFEYIKTLINTNSIEFIDPNLKSFDELLDSEKDLDYIGTRLHAGIRAMQKKRRSIIIGVDNRALEMAKDFNINVIKRSELYKMENYIKKKIYTNIKLDLNTINAWKNQFK